MEFKFTENTKTISEINKLLRSNSLMVDHSYQRRKIWSDADKIRLIETILLNYVVPSVYWWQSRIDPDTGESKTHIVDGQQRLTAISEFVTGNLKLNKNSLLDKDCREIYHNKYFSELSDEDKTKIWNYKISVIEIDKNAKEDDVINMFNRLNLTEYTLNSQEKRHAKRGLFHDFATELSENNFWQRIKIFSGADVKRMNDVTYCANIIILAKRGIVDQAKIDKPINEAYEKYKKDYPEIDDDKKLVEDAINNFIKIIDYMPQGNYNNFFNKKVQNYSLFSLIFYMIRRKEQWTDERKNFLKYFIDIYQNFKNENSESLELNDKQQELFDYFRKYKLASSEGVNKLANRTIRFNVLKDLIVNDEGNLIGDIELVNSLKLKISETDS
ncbi:DUF262 domain-containing protein [Lactococcus lactis]|uniref:DUF262 domain-containing protein n=1 Tax=Lactococcus lactis TaxID=1358 RepID=UPI0019111C3F|nr:DUF262 domain-containing protein [Lactococcus lactis]QQE99195.1 DUF262 domain-containing protein [Lactococcus lactis]